MGERGRWPSCGVVLSFCLVWTSQLAVSCPQRCMCQNATEVSNVTSVTCSQGNLTSVPRDVPEDVQRLDLSGNEITVLGFQLRSLVHLQYLDLSFNSLSAFTTSVFDDLYNLQILDLSQNAFSSINSKIFGDLASVEELNLSGNNLTNLENGAFFGLKTVKKLYLSYNRISYVKNGTFLFLEQLEVLDFSHNALMELESFSFEGLTSLEQLLLQHNSISYIEAGTFKSLVILKHLDLSYNSLTSIDAMTFMGMPKLASLSLTGNHIQDMAADFMGGNSSQLLVLHLTENKLTNISIPLFSGLDRLENLTLNRMPSLTKVAFNAFHGLPSLRLLDISHNPGLGFVNPHLLDHLPLLTSLDLSHDNLSALSLLTFHHNPKLETVRLQGNAFVCSCSLAWLAKKVTSKSPVFVGELWCLSNPLQNSVSLDGASHLASMCGEVGQVNTTDLVHLAIASQVVIRCRFHPDPDSMLVWTIPRHAPLTYHAFHPDATAHLLDEEDLPLNSSFHASHPWHNSSSYQAGLLGFRDRVRLLKDGSLYIDYVLRGDNGPYICLVMNAYHNSSSQVWVKFDYRIVFNVKIMSIVVGLGSAMCFLIFTIIYSAISAMARRLVNKRRREAIHSLILNLDTYKTTQFTKLRENYCSQLTRIREQYHMQFHRLSDNYHSQMKKVKMGYTHQVDKIRDNYTTQVGRLRNYSSHQVDQIREMYNGQLFKIRDYGSLQMVRLHHKYKLKQQHVIKLLEMMNLDNCKTVIETECMRTESMIFELDILRDAEVLRLSPLSGSSDSEYVTASDSENSSRASLDLPLEGDHPQLFRNGIDDECIVALEDGGIEIPELFLDGIDDSSIMGVRGERREIQELYLDGINDASIMALGAERRAIPDHIRDRINEVNILALGAERREIPELIRDGIDDACRMALECEEFKPVSIVIHQDNLPSTV